MKILKEVLLSTGITSILVLASISIGYPSNPIQNVTLYFIIVIWLKTIKKD